MSMRAVTKHIYDNIPQCDKFKNFTIKCCNYSFWVKLLIWLFFLNKKVFMKYVVFWIEIFIKVTEKIHILRQRMLSYCPAQISGLHKHEAPAKLRNIYLRCVWRFHVGPGSIWEGGVYDLYCRPPPGGVLDTQPLLLTHFHPSFLCKASSFN